MGIFAGVIGIIIGVAGAVAVGSALSKSFRRSIKRIGKSVAKIVRQVADTAWDITGGLILKATAEGARLIANVAGWLGANKLSSLLRNVASLPANLNKFIKHNLGGAIESLVSGHISESFRYLGNTVGVALTIVAGVVAFFTGQWYAIPAAVLSLDMQVNQGKAFVKPFVDFTASALEKVGWEKAKEYKDEMMAAVGFISSVICAYGGAGALEFFGVGANIQSLYNTAMSALAVYGGYVTIKDYQELREMLAKELEKLRAYYEEMQNAKKVAEAKRFRAFLDYSIYDWCAGGKNYNSYCVGEVNYDYCNVIEPYKTLLAEPESKKTDEFTMTLLKYKSLNEYDEYFEKMLEIDPLIAVKTINKKGQDKGDSVIIREITDSADFYWTFATKYTSSPLHTSSFRWQSVLYRDVSDETNLVGAVEFINARRKHNIPITTSEITIPIYETNEKGEKVFVKNETITIKHTPIEDEKNWRNYAGVKFSVVQNTSFNAIKKVKVTVTYTTTELTI